jgi:hypothetical protein
MRRLLLLLPLLLLAPAVQVHAQVPTYANNGTSCAFGGPHTATGLICPLKYPTGSNNAIVCAFIYPDAVTGTRGCTDDKSNTYTRAGTFTDGFGHAIIDIWVACGATAGATQIEPLFNSNTFVSTTDQAIVAEYYNVATTSCFEIFNGNANSSASITTASSTPGASGEMLLQFAFSDSGQATGWTVGSQSNITWRLRAAVADDSGAMNAQAFQYGVYNSAAAITPTMSNAGGAQWITASVFLKAATAGTAPPAGLRLTFDQQVDLNNLAIGTRTLQFPHYGVTQVMDYVSGGGTLTTTGTPTESCGNTLTQATGSPFQGTPDSNDTHIYFFTKNATACGAGTLSWVLAGTNQSASMHQYDIEGADTVTPVCDSNGNGRIETAHGTQGNLNNVAVVTVAITPCRANGAVIWSMGIGTGGAISLTSPTGAILGSCIPRPFQATTDCDENNGFAVFPNSGVSALTFTMQPEQAPNGISGWDAAAMAIQPPASAAAPKKPPVVIGQGAAFALAVAATTMRLN